MAVCREVMTPEPTCCQASDSIVRVAQLMKTEDVGAVPVVESSSSRRLVGMVTDRDIVVKGLAAGRSVEDATVKEVMRLNLKTKTFAGSRGRFQPRRARPTSRGCSTGV